MSTYFDSRDPACKSPFGAVPCGTEVSFAVFCTDEENIAGGELRVTEEFAGKEQAVPLSLSGGAWRCVYAAPAQPELAWYSFSLRRRSGETVTLAQRQLTVYEERGAAPDWFGRGVSYQIFPDRFCRSRLPDAAGLVGDRTVHENWQDTPEYRPDERGEIRNRDFFGGDLAGIISKLDYLKSLGVTTLYLNPIFEAASNHRYNTADYMAIDPMLGTEEDFRALCREAHARGMRVLLDGVFNHTGSASRYFNADGFYPDLGAAQSKDSPYYNWYHFSHWPDSYDAWWGIKTLPAVEENQASYRDFIIRSEDSVVRHWLRCGADGWRLDVADELPDDFIAELRQAMDAEKPDCLLLGEVWEDGSNKIAYDRRRKYLLGRETHGLMNYPFRTAALDWLCGGDAAAFRESMEQLRENYPAPAFYSAMNFLSTHDTPRVLTLLGGEPTSADKAERAAARLSPAGRELARRRLMLGALLLYAFPGSPTVYYGDEAGMEGYEDPLNRRTFPWGQEDEGLLRWYRRLGQLRGGRPSLQRGNICYLYADGSGLALRRQWDGEVTTAAMNSGKEPLTMTLSWPHPIATDAMTGQQFLADHGAVRLTLPPVSGVLLV